MNKDTAASDNVMRNPTPATKGKFPPPERKVNIPAADTPNKDNVQANTGPTNATSAVQGSPNKSIITDKTKAIEKPVICDINKSFNPRKAIGYTPRETHNTLDY
tara:strand:- start:1041 stop:1352 length:312 start_codon:yes stop_codon:yes gene_type:complete